MATKAPELMNLPLTDRLGFRLTALFLIVFAATFLIGLVADVIGSLAYDATAESIEANKPATVTDQNIEDELARVVGTDLTPERTEIRDPFTDRAGLSGRTAANVASVTSTTSERSATTDADAAGSNSSLAAASGLRDVSLANGAAPKPEIDPASAEATLSRIRARNDRLARGLTAGAESEVFAIADLTPVGLVSGGNGAQEVIFFSAALGRNMGFPVGSRLFDGWLAGVSSEGVEFRGFETNIARFKSWARGE